MDIFTKRRLTAAIIILLIVLNLASLGSLWYLYMRKPPLPHPEQFREDRRDAIPYFFKREMGLTNKQFSKLRTLRKSHLAEMQTINQNIRNLKKRLVQQIFSDTPDQMAIDSLSAAIGRHEGMREQKIALHLIEMRALLNDKQKVKMRRLMRHIIEHGRPRPDNRPDKFRERGFHHQRFKDRDTLR